MKAEQRYFKTKLTFWPMQAAWHANFKSRELGNKKGHKFDKIQRHLEDYDTTFSCPELSMFWDRRSTLSHDYKDMPQIRTQLLKLLDQKNHILQEVEGVLLRLWNPPIWLVKTSSKIVFSVKQTNVKKSRSLALYLGARIGTCAIATCNMS